MPKSSQGIDKENLDQRLLLQKPRCNNFGRLENKNKKIISSQFLQNSCKTLRGDNFKKEDIFHKSNLISLINRKKAFLL